MKTNQLVMLALLTGSLAACTKNEPEKPADTSQAPASLKATAATKESDACEVCDWNNVLNEDLKVRRAFCAEGDEHCHLEVSDYIPARTAKVAVVEEAVYSFEMLSNSGTMTCARLTVDPINEDRILGQCIIDEPNMEGKPEHNFSATMESDPDNDKVPRLVITFDHRGSAGEEGHPVHNGEVHVNK